MTRAAYCGGRAVDVAVRDAPAPRFGDTRRVRCRTCGAQPRMECRDIESKALQWDEHASRKADAVAAFGAA